VDLVADIEVLEAAIPDADGATPAKPRAGWCVGRITEITPNGVVMVDFAGSPNGPCAARSTLWAHAEQAFELIAPFRCVGRPGTVALALLAFEAVDPCRPIVVGLLPPDDTGLRGVPMPAAPPLSVSVDGQRVTIVAGSEIALVCGKSSIVMTADGKIVIKGSNLMSRSSGGNRIRGATVQIN
jgi:hypothetical protein